MKWKLGNLAGIGVYLHWSFWLLPLWILLSQGQGLGSALASILFVFAVFGCVVLHELGHALAARHYGIATRDITLYPIGGIASLQRIPEDPRQELVIAVAGPAVNVAIAGSILLGMMAGAFTSPVSLLVIGQSFIGNLLIVNLGLVVFNLLPAFPMDGGRVLRALLAMPLPYLQATQIAARVGQGFALLLGLAGLLLPSPSLLLVAAFVFFAAKAEATLVQRRALERTSFIVNPLDPNEIVWLGPVTRTR